MEVRVSWLRVRDLRGGNVTDEKDDGERLLDALVEASEAAEELGFQELSNECGRLYQEAGRLVIDDD